MRRVGPNPETYALSAVVRRDASATSTSRTGTPSADAIAIRLVLSGLSGIGVNLLNTGSTSTGKTNVISTVRPAAPAARNAHHHRGASRVTPKNPSSTTAPMTAPTAYDLSRSTVHEPQVWVDNPYRRRIVSCHMASGSVTTSPIATSTNPPSTASAIQFPPNGRPTAPTRRAPSGVRPRISAKNRHSASAP